MSRWIRSQIESLDPTVLVSVETLRQRVGQMADQPRFEAVLVVFFAASGLLLSMIGLYGVIAFIANQRTQEIGVALPLVLVALAATLIPARVAMNVEPVAALHYE